jgi:flagellar biogenesis protein FliO
MASAKQATPASVEPTAPADFEPPPLDPSSMSVAAEAAADDPRRLAPRHDRRLPFTLRRDRSLSASSSLPSFGVPFESLYSTGAALAIVVGLFLLCAWVVRRGTRRSTAALPDDVVSVLGRVPLAARRFAELIRVGNKLVLVSITPDGAEPLTEITDPVEIDRLLGLCRQRMPHSATSEFDQVFRQLAQEAAPVGFLGSDDHPFDARLAAPGDAFSAYREGPSRG